MLPERCLYKEYTTPVIVYNGDFCNLQVFDEWNKGELDSFLIEITRDILKFKDTDGEYLLEKIKDTAGQVRLPY